MKATVFGAGNIGRGLVGAVLADSGYDLTYVDADSALVALLSDASYFELVTQENRRRIPIEAAIDASDLDAVIASVARSELVATAVGEPILRVVAPAIGAGLESSLANTVNVLACENIHPNSTLLGDHIAAATSDEVTRGVGFPNVVVDRIVPGAGGTIDVNVETEFDFVVDGTAWVGSRPETASITFADDIEAYELRKLWLVNGIHAITAWMGIAAGHEYIHQAIVDPKIRGDVAAAAEAAARALADLTDEFELEALQTYAATVLGRFANAELADPTVRVARNPLAKLGPGERILGPAVAAEARSLDIGGFAAGIAAALRLEDQAVVGLEELKEEIKETGWEQFLVGHGGVPEKGAIVEAVRAQLEAVSERRDTSVISEEIVIANPSGLHARPAAEIVEQAKTVNATVQIKKGEKTANAASIMSVLALGANTGDTVTVIAEGEDAEAAVSAMLAIMNATEH